MEVESLLTSLQSGQYALQGRRLQRGRRLPRELGRQGAGPPPADPQAAAGGAAQPGPAPHRGTTLELAQIEHAPVTRTHSY